MSVRNTLGFLWKHPLSKGHFAGTLGRFVRWQLVSRLCPDAVFVIPWINGMKLVARRGETGVTGNLYCGLHEFEEMAFTIHLLRAGDLFLDAGANSGVFTILACGVVGANGIAVEPVPSTFQRLTDHVLLNRIGSRVACFQSGLGAESGTIEFTSGLDTINHAVAPGEENAGDTVSVSVTTIDEICHDQVPALVKIDVEGYESFVLDGAARTFHSPELKAVVMEVNGSGERYGMSDRDLIKRMLDLGFHAVHYDPWERKITPAAKLERYEGNLIFARDLTWIENRCASSPRYLVGSQQV